MTKKRVISLLLAVVLTMSLLAGCSGSKGEANAKEDSGKIQISSICGTAPCSRS